MADGDAIRKAFISEDVRNCEGLPANVVDAIDDLADAVRTVRGAITPSGNHAPKDASEKHVDSLTEAVMGITAGLYAVAGAIENLAEAVRDK